MHRTAFTLLGVGCTLIALGFALAANERRFTTIPETGSIEVHVVERTTNTYDLSLEYPIITLPKEKSAQNANTLIREHVTMQEESFLGSLTAEENMSDGPKSFFNLSYESGVVTENIVSISFPVSVYNQGAAHPMHFTTSLLIHPETESLYTLFDIIKEDSRTPLFQMLHDHVVSEHNTEGWWVSDILEQRVIPAHLLTEHSMTFFFDPYAIAPYAAGPIEVTIPRETMQKFFTEEFKTLVTPPESMDQKIIPFF